MLFPGEDNKGLYLEWSNICPQFLNSIIYNQVFINHCTEDFYHFNLDFSYHCSFGVYLCRHLTDPIPVILIFMTSFVHNETTVLEAFYTLILNLISTISDLIFKVL